MKTLKQILLESEYQFGLDLKDNINVKKLKPLTSTLEFNFLNDAEPVNIFKFTMTKKPLVTIDGQSMDPADELHVVKTFQDTLKNSNYKDPPQDHALLVIHDTRNKRIWYFIEVNTKNKIGKIGQIPISDILNKFPTTDIIIKNYEGNSYYWLRGAPAARMDAVGAKTNQKEIDDAKQENRRKWTIWIPKEDYKNGQTHSTRIDRIRKLVGDKSVNDTFDDVLETSLKAWQKENKIPDTGEWDTRSQQTALQVLQDRPFENLNTEIENFSALKKPIAKTTSTASKPTTVPADQVKLAKNYRQWANSTPELIKKYGKKSSYDLDSIYSENPANVSFDQSYKDGQAEFEKDGGMGKQWKAWKKAKTKIDGNTDTGNFKRKG